MLTKCTGIVAVLMTAARFDTGFDVAELVVNDWQLRPHAHGSNVSESTTGATPQVFCFLHHTRANAGPLLRRVDRQQADVAAISVKLHIDAGRENLFFN